MALYKWDVMLAGVSNWFNPASAWTTGQILTKTASGYDWDDAPDSSNVKAFPLSWTWSSAAVLAEAQEAYDWYNAGKTALISYGDNLFTFASWNTSTVYFTNIKCENMTGTSTSWIVYDLITLNKTDDTITNVTFTDKWWIISANYLSTSANYSTPYTPLYNGSPATKKYVDDNAWMKLAPNSPLSPKYHWFWTEAQYQALSQYYTDEENDTVYYTI